MNINLFKNQINDIVEKKKYVNSNIRLGYINNKIMNFNININTFRRVLDFLKSKNNYEIINKKIYYYFDKKLESHNENIHYVFKKNETKYNDFFIKVNNKKMLNHSFLRFDYTDNIIIDNIYFPSLDKYHNEENIETYKFKIKYKKSEIIIEMNKHNNNINSINIKSKFDSNSKEDYFKNLQFVLSKIFYQKINL